MVDSDSIVGTAVCSQSPLSGLPPRLSLSANGSVLDGGWRWFWPPPPANGEVSSTVELAFYPFAVSEVTGRVDVESPEQRAIENDEYSTFD